MTDAGLLLLAATAIGSAAGDDPLEYVARMLDEAGWQNRDGSRLTKWQARDTAADTHIVLIRLGALVQARQGPGPEQPTGGGAAFARAALRTWPA